MNREMRLKKHRRYLHQIPETGFDLTVTNQYVKDQLYAMGYQLFTYAKTGIVAFKKGEKQTSIAFRADMDGLAIEEQNDIEYRSTHLGKMHACGHDGHMAMLLEFAYFMKDKPLNQHSLVLLFQPAEEGPGGAKPMIEEGVMDHFNIIKIFGIHLYPGIEEGKLGFVKGAMMARNGEMTLTITGSSSHGAEPHRGIDAILVASQLVQQVHTIVSRNVNPLESAVITIGVLQAGEAPNVIARKALIKGTIRAFNDDVYFRLKQRIFDICSGVEKGFEVKIDVTILDYYPIVVNDDDLFEEVTQSLPLTSYRLIRPMSFSEDFAFFQQKAPGLFAMLGTLNQEKGFTIPLHNSRFNFDEAVLVKGVEYFIHLARLYQ